VPAAAHPLGEEFIMFIQTRSVGAVDVFTVSGDLTLGSEGLTLVADKVRGLVQRKRAQIVVDVSGVRYVDSVGLGALVEAWAAARHRGGSLKLVGVRQWLSAVLSMTNLLGAFECFDSESEAIASFPRGHVRP
jgi:anti-sigma B factor antagonist